MDGSPVYENAKKIPWMIISYDPTSPFFRFSPLESLLRSGMASTRLFTSLSVPESVATSKKINIDRQAIPGGSTAVPQFGNFGETTIKFSLKLARMNREMGVTPDIQFFESLRRPAFSLYDTFAPAASLAGSTPSSVSKPFQPNPKVIYFYGTGMLPMNYVVSDVEIVNRAFNEIGNPQVSEITMQLDLDEDGPLFALEMQYMQFTVALKTLGLYKAFVGRERAANPYIGKDPSKFFGLAA